MNKQTISGVSLMLAAVMLAACSESGSKPADGKSDVVQDVSKMSAVLTFYNTTANEPLELFMKKYGDPIAKKFPNYKINYVQAAKGSTLAEMITAGTMNVDILIAAADNTYQNLLVYNLQDDISDLVKKYNFDLNRLEPTAIDIQRQMANGGIYGIPFSISTTALFYNKDLFDKFAQPYPKDGMTWDDAYAVAQKMTRSEGGVQYKGAALAFTHLLGYNQSSAPLVDSKTNKSAFTGDLYKREFENLARFFKIPGVGMPQNAKTYSLGPQNDMFFKDRVAALWLHITRAAVTLWSTVPDFTNWDMAQLPQWKDKPGVGPQASGYYFYQTKTSKARDAAFQVLMYVASDEFQRHTMRQGYMSSLKNPGSLMNDLAADYPIAKNQNLKAFLVPKYAAPAAPHRYASLANDEISKALGEMVTDGADINTALRSAAERADKAIAEQLIKEK
ncbi:MAG: extracellular solute-binding protein family 1 [Paenibacillus sp.]|jgi:multiple sugar transport system substrate-binding protein|nr:extracellular solute-binding protein family 1 [Paenibacillus sp.]